MAVRYLVSIQEAEFERMIRARSINNKRSIMEHVTSYITHLTALTEMNILNTYNIRKGNLIIKNTLQIV